MQEIKKMLQSLNFLFWTKPLPNFNQFCTLFVNGDDLLAAKEILQKTLAQDIHAFIAYTDNRGSLTAKMWAEAELQRRDFILKQWSMLISLLAFFISTASLIVSLWAK